MQGRRRGVLYAGAGSGRLRLLPGIRLPCQSVWSNILAGDRIHISDVTVAKNYLNEEEISDFNRLTSLCLDFVEDQAKNRREIFLHEWEDKLNELLRLMGRRVLKGKGQRSKKQAQEHVRGQYRLYEERRRLKTERQAEQDYVKELERDIKKLENKKGHKPSSNPGR